MGARKYKYIDGGCGAAPPAAMSLISWNCQGLGNPWTVRNLYELVKENNPDVLFLIETRMKAVQIDKIRRRLHFSFAFPMPSRGRKGGLAILWRDMVDLEIKNYSHSHIDAIVQDPTEKIMWCLTGFYGSPKRCNQPESWKLLRRLGDQNRLPWVVFGDFNEILGNSEKLGKALRVESQMDAFREVLESLSLRDLGFRGAWYTWDNHRLGVENIKERLDKVVATMHWSTLFPKACVNHLCASTSDHRPFQILLQEPVTKNKRRRPFRFEQAWTRLKSCDTVVSEAWHSNTPGSHMFEVTEAIKSCQRELMKWDKEVFRSSQQKIHQLGEVLRRLEDRAMSEENHHEMKKLKSEMNVLSGREEIKWRQRSRVQWLEEGNRNTKFFHNKANQRRRKNAIEKLMDEHGRIQADPTIIEQITVSYFTQIYTCSNPHNFGPILEAIETSVTEDMNARLSQEFKAEEVVLALNQMFPTKSPGPDGMSAFFYQKYWHIVGPKVTSTVLEILNFGYMLKKINYTYIALIPKKCDPEKITDFRPINLCNVIYKIVSKVLANRLKTMVLKTGPDRPVQP
jgi:exonuclease III